jgi:flagellar protein FlgJ
MTEIGTPLAPSNPSIAKGSLAAPAASDEKAAEVRAAAEQFEAIFVRRLLATARSSPWAEQGPFTGPGLKQFETMLDENIADLTAQNGGFGLADQIERQLSALLKQQGA